MGAFLAYNLKLSFCFVLFYMLYKTILSRNTFYRINRRVLLSSYLIILFVPFIDLRTHQPTDIYLFISGYEQFFTHPTAVQIQWTDIIVSVYLAGMLFFGLRYLYFTAKIGLILLQGEKVREQTGRRLVITNKHIAPFSWMNFMVISRTDWMENREAIMAHESAHIANSHFMDLFIAEIFSVIQWYNPSIWLIKNELKDIHEFEADDMVLDSGLNPKQYQLLLIKKAVGSQRFNSMTNSLNHSKLKKRITMMLKEKSSPWAKMKYLTILPLIAFALAVFARPEISENLDRISEVKVSELTSIIETKIENFSAPPEKVAETIPLPVMEKDTLPVERRERIKQELLQFLEQKRSESDNEEVRKSIDETRQRVIQDLEEVRKRFESEEWKNELRTYEMSAEMREQLNRQIAEVRRRFESEEWKNEMKRFEMSAEMREKLRQQMEEVRRRFESEEWKNEMKRFEMSAEMREKLRQQVEEVRKRSESEEWKVR